MKPYKSKTHLWNLYFEIQNINIILNLFFYFSFLLYVSGFMAIEIAGICAVFLFISWQQREWSKKRVELHAMNHRRKHSNASTINIDQQLYTGGMYIPIICSV